MNELFHVDHDAKSCRHQTVKISAIKNIFKKYKKSTVKRVNYIDLQGCKQK